MIRLVNLTPHQLRVYDDDRVIAEYAPATEPARIRESRTPLPPLHLRTGSIPRAHVAYQDDTESLPDPVPGIRYVVSRIVAFARPDRSDLVFPLDEVRDERGRIIGCRTLGSATQR